MRDDQVVRETPTTPFPSKRLHEAPRPPTEESRRQAGIQSRVLEWLQNHPGLEITPGHIARDLDDLDDHQVSGAMAHLAKAGSIQRVRRGIYVYLGLSRPAASPDGVLLVGDLLEVIGKTVEGDPILRTPDGVLFRVQAL